MPHRKMATQVRSPACCSALRVGFIAFAQGVVNELADIKMRTRQANADSRSPELGNLLGPFEDNAGIVFQ
jgi:hypothetical protein